MTQRRAGRGPGRMGTPPTATPAPPTWPPSRFIHHPPQPASPQPPSRFIHHPPQPASPQPPSRGPHQPSSTPSMALIGPKPAPSRCAAHPTGRTRSPGPHPHVPPPPSTAHPLARRGPGPWIGLPRADWRAFLLCIITVIERNNGSGGWWGTRMGAGPDGTPPRAPPPACLPSRGRSTPAARPQRRRAPPPPRHAATSSTVRTPPSRCADPLNGPYAGSHAPSARTPTPIGATRPLPSPSRDSGMGSRPHMALDFGGLRGLCVAPGHGP